MHLQTKEYDINQYLITRHILHFTACFMVVTNIVATHSNEIKQFVSHLILHRPSGVWRINTHVYLVILMDNGARTMFVTCMIIWK